MHLRRLLAASLIVLLTLPAEAGATTVGSKISGMAAAAGFGGPSTAFAVFDVTRARWLYLNDGERPLKPASNMKLTTTAAALGRIGAGARLTTRVYYTGNRSGSTLNGNIWLVGGGDPSLSTSDYSAKRFGGVSAILGDLAQAVRSAGITRVNGRVFGDGSRFDAVHVGPFWKPEYRIDCPPISGLSVNEDWVRFGSSASYSKPTLRSASAFRSSLISHGVSVSGPAAVHAKPAGAGALLGSVTSPPMYRLILQMNLPSDNYYAEVLNKDIAVARGLGGTTANGRYATRNYLQLLRVNTTNWRLADGSGLSLADRLTTQGIVSLLNHVRMQSYAFWFRNSLPTAGVSGTLKNRMRTGPAHGNARAKTGTLRDASALSGYVTSANGHTILFSMIMNHAPDLDITRARALQDRVVQLIAGSRPA
jgi:serine-type D-Ala-D-Ala carboxypeptidase/endopeptidase (penicillin-binding protein 4)